MDDATEASLTPEDYGSELARKLSQVQAPSAKELAELFVLASGGSELHDVTVNCLHDWLVRYTLREARAMSPYYRDRAVYTDLPSGPPGHAIDLTPLPVIDRSIVTEHHDAFVSDKLELRQICHSSGTTGEPLEVHKSYAEIAFIADYFTTMFSPLRAVMEKLPLTLAFPNVNHGMPVPIPGFGKTFYGGVTDDTLINDAVRVLRTEYRIRGHQERITILTGLEHHVLFFTSYLLERGIDPHTFGLQAVNITGNYVARHWRDFLADSWRCPVNDRFTLTDFIGGASRIGVSDEFILDPHIVGEVLDVNDNPVEEGVGRLILTGLAPWIQMQPLVRYDTGDLVWRTRHDGNSQLTFRFLGKRKNSVSRTRNGIHEWLLFSGPLNDILSPFPDIRLYEWFANVRSARDRTIGSLPIVGVTANDAATAKMTLCIAIELRYAPDCFHSRSREIIATVTRKLRAVEGTVLADAIDRGEVQLVFDLRPPEGLETPITIKI